MCIILTNHVVHFQIFTLIIHESMNKVLRKSFNNSVLYYRNASPINQITNAILASAVKNTFLVNLPLSPKILHGLSISSSRQNIQLPQTLKLYFGTFVRRDSFTFQIKSYLAPFYEVFFRFSILNYLTISIFHTSKYFLYDITENDSNTSSKPYFHCSYS